MSCVERHAFSDEGLFSILGKEVSPRFENLVFVADVLCFNPAFGV